MFTVVTHVYCSVTDYYAGVLLPTAVELLESTTWTVNQLPAPVDIDSGEFSVCL